MTGTAHATTLSGSYRGGRPLTLGERALESGGGVIFSIALHVLAASFLIRFEAPTPRREPPRNDIVRITLTSPPPDADTPPPPIPMVDAAGASSTQPPDPAANADLEQFIPRGEPEPLVPLYSGEQSPDARPDVVPTFVPDPAAALHREVDATLSDEQRRFLAQRTERREQQERQLDRRQSEIVRATDKESMISKARQLGINSAGAIDGVVRTMQLKGVPDDILKRVLLKNGIEILYAELEAGAAAASPIGTVATDGGAYHAQPITRPGVYEIVRLTPKALATIGRLELEYLRDHRLDPMKTKMISVTFGIANLGGNRGYDLVILSADHRSLD